MRPESSRLNISFCNESLSVSILSLEIELIQSLGPLGQTRLKIHNLELNCHVSSFSPHVPNFSALAILIRQGRNRAKMPIWDFQSEFPRVSCISRLLDIVRFFSKNSLPRISRNFPAFPWRRLAIPKARLRGEDEVDMLGSGEVSANHAGFCQQSAISCLFGPSGKVGNPENS